MTTSTSSGDAGATTITGKQSKTSRPSDPAISIKLGTDCSGMDTPAIALRNMGINFTHLFSCDNDKYSKEFIMKNSSPKVFYDDINCRKSAKLPDMPVSTVFYSWVQERS